MHMHMRVHVRLAWSVLRARCAGLQARAFFGAMSRTYIVDRFEINPDDILGTGGFGQVLRSLDKNSGEVVAAKVIDTKRMRREKILQEIQLMERVGGHSGVVGLRGAQEVAELHQIFIFMELAQVPS